MKLCELLVQLAHWEKKILASKKTFKSAVLAARTSGKRTNMRDQAEQNRRMSLNPAPSLFDLQIRLVVSSKKLVWSANQTSKPVHGRTAGQRPAAGLNAGDRQQCNIGLETGGRVWLDARPKGSCAGSDGLQGEETLWWKLLKRRYGIVEWTRRCKILYSFHFWAKLLLKQRFSKSYIWSLVCGEGRGTSS